MKDKLLITTSPQFHNGDSTFTVMWGVSLALLPATIWGFLMFGISSVVVVAVSIAASILGELMLNLVYKKRTLWDGSAFLTGLLIGLNMPPELPLHIPIAASLFAMLIVKGAFGGLGNNWMNPALAGRVFVMFSWTKPMTVWKNPILVDSATSATPLGAVKSSLLGYECSALNPMELLKETSSNSTTYMDLFIGRVGGTIGEVSALLLCVGAIFLIIKKVIRWEIYITYLSSFALLIWAFAGTRFNAGLFTGDVLFHILSGGFVLGLFFMSTDMVTSPVTSKGMIVYGLGCGFFTFLLRIYGSGPEGVSLAIIVMNIVVPLINRYSKPRLFGHKKRGKVSE